MKTHYLSLFFTAVAGLWLTFAATPASAACSYNFNTHDVKVNESSTRFPSITVSPGEQVAIELPYSLSNTEICRNCIRQIVVGVEREAKYCAYSGIPATCTDGLTEGTDTSSFTAPMAPGRYVIYAFDAAHLSCDIALENYPDQGGADVTGPFAKHEEAIGEIVVVDDSVQGIVMDIKPGSCTNPLNTNSNGVLPVAVLGSQDFDVTQINIDTVSLEGVAPLRYSIEDVTGPNDCGTEMYDGYLDLNLKFDTPAIVDAIGPVNNGDEVTLTLTGQLFDGTPIEAQDKVLIRMKSK